MPKITYWLLFAILLISGCRPAPPKKTTASFMGNAMTMNYSIIIGSPLNEAQYQAAYQIISSTFYEINTIYNKFNPNSELSRLNALKAGEKAPISKDLENFLILTSQLVALSDGRFDPTVEPIQQLWKEKLAHRKEPLPQEIEDLIPAVGWDKIHFGQGVFYKDHDLTRLDLGGIAKGHAVDLLTDRLNAAGYINLFVEWGGEIRATGNHPDNRPWNIFISRFDDTNPENAIAILPLQNQAIATSGDYLQYWTTIHAETGEEAVYFHIINPATFRPLVRYPGNIASASVAAPTCALADGLATTAMMFPSKEEAEAWSKSIQEKLPGIKFWLVPRDLGE